MAGDERLPYGRNRCAMTINGEGTTYRDVPRRRMCGQSKTSIFQILQEYVHRDPGLRCDGGRRTGWSRW